MFSRSVRDFLRDKRGTVAITFAASVLPLSMMAGVAADYSLILKERTALQDLADGAALHAMRGHLVGGKAEAQLEAEAAVALGLPAKTEEPQPESVDVTLGASPALSATATLTRQVDLIFGGFYSQDGKFTIQAAAKAGEGEATPVSLLLLARGGTAWQMGGTSDVAIENGAARVNSVGAAALSGSGNATATSDGVYVSGAAAPAANWTPKPIWGVPAMADPFAKLPWPSASACDHTDRVVKKTTVSLEPGVYCGGLRLETHGVANLDPGLYVLDGPLLLSSHAELNAPSGVTIVMVGSDSYLDVHSGAELRVVAPTTGPWANIAIAQKPQSSELTSTLIGGGELKLNGVIYLPTQKLVVTGGGSSEFEGARIVVASRLQTQGNGQVVLRGDEKILKMPSGARLLN